MEAGVAAVVVIGVPATLTGFRTFTGRGGGGEGSGGGAIRRLTSRGSGGDGWGPSVGRPGHHIVPACTANDSARAMGKGARMRNMD